MNLTENAQRFLKDSLPLEDMLPTRMPIYVNSLHFWGVQVFFGTLLMHMIIKFLMAAWRDGRWKTWFVGALPTRLHPVAAVLPG